jgi:hypothetical protein
MLDFTPVREKKMTLQALVKDLDRDDLRRELNAMYVEVERLISDCVDADVVFQPIDSEASDPYGSEEEKGLAWNLGHVIVHLIASMEESASLAQELARGVTFHGRSRWEYPWREVRTIDQCRTYLKESRRICLAALDMWPDIPHLDNTYAPFEGAVPHTCVSRFAGGLKHASDHLGQIAEIVRQGRESRKAERLSNVLFLEK